MTAPITVVIPAYNRAHTLPRTLASLAAQTVMPAAVVLVDNASTDNTLAVMHQWAATAPVPCTVVTETQRGACAARNCGLAHVRTRLVMFFDSDDEMLPTHVERYARAAERHPQAQLLGADIWLQDTDGSRRRLRFTRCMPLFNHIFGASVSTSRFVADAGLVRRVGGWDTRLKGWDDYELGLRLLLQHPVIVRLDGQPTVINHAQEQSLTGTAYSHHPERWEQSLQLMRSHVADNARHRFWVDARTAVLAADYAAEARTLPTAAERRTAARAAQRLRATLPARAVPVYLWQRLLGRLARIPALLLAPW